MNINEHIDSMNIMFPLKNKIIKKDESESEIEESTSDEEIENNKVVKKRGRPPKNKNNVIKKDDESEFEIEEFTSDDESESEIEECSSNDEIENNKVVKKRGRPPKNKNENNEVVKKRGRPPKNKNENNEGVKKRGRPPKNKNENNEGVKKRGRPPKNKNENNEGVKKRDKYHKKMIIDDDSEFEMEEFTSDDEIEKSRKRTKSSESINLKSKKSFDNNENKNIANMIFASRMGILKKSGNYDEYNSYLGLLDSYEHNTSHHIEICGIDRKNILIIESDINVHNSHIKEKFNSFHGTLEEYSKKKTSYCDKICLGWYFDTCGTIKTQEYGILQTIEKLNLISGSVLGFTFCRRGVPINEHYNNHENFRDKLIKILGKKGFGFEKIFSNDYSGNKIDHRTNGNPMNNFFLEVI